MFHSTTILAVRHRDHAVLAGDGQVTFGQTVVKQSARKIRRLYNDRILAGFAGSAADWVNKLNLLIGDETLRQRLGMSGRRYVEQQHTWSACLSGLPELLATATGQSVLATHVAQFA